jgi:hypothetical protein
MLRPEQPSTSNVAQVVTNNTSPFGHGGAESLQNDFYAVPVCTFLKKVQSKTLFLPIKKLEDYSPQTHKSAYPQRVKQESRGYVKGASPKIDQIFFKGGLRPHPRIGFHGRPKIFTRPQASKRQKFFGLSKKKLFLVPSRTI